MQSSIMRTVNLANYLAKCLVKVIDTFKVIDTGYLAKNVQ